MDYCYVNKGLVQDGPRRLPKQWKKGFYNITSMHLMSNAELKKIGWLPVNYSNPIFDKETQKLGNRVVTIREDDVLISKTAINLTLDEKTQKWKNEMNQDDKIVPRWTEDIYDALDSSTKAKLSDDPKGFKAKVEVKKLKRAAKPK